MRSAAARATVWVVLSACGFGAIAIFTTVGTRAGSPLLNLLAWRYILASLVLGGLALSQRLLRANGAVARVVAITGVGQALVAVVSLSALRYIPAATLAFLFYTFPAWVAVLARLRHSEPLTPRRLTALALSLGGVFVMVGSPAANGASLNVTGVALALVAALLYAVYIPIIGALQRGHGALATSTYMAVGAGIILGVTAATRGELTLAMTPVVWGASLGLALISTVIAFLLFLRGLDVLGPVRTAIISTVEPFVTALLGAWVLDQPLSQSTLLGGALIAAAVVLLQLRANNDSGRNR